jgi:Ca2+-binding EF-hand superfamily protein
MCFLVSPQQKRLKYLRLLEMFNKYEKDGSGYLSNNELIEIFRLRGYDVDDPLVIGCIHVREQIHREDFLSLSSTTQAHVACVDTNGDQRKCQELICANSIGGIES